MKFQEHNKFPLINIDIFVIHITPEILSRFEPDIFRVTVHCPTRWVVTTRWDIFQQVILQFRKANRPITQKEVTEPRSEDSDVLSGYNNHIVVCQ